MAIETSSYPVRECAQTLLRIVAEMGDRIDAATSAMEQPVLKLLQQPDLLTVGVRREGNHVGYSAYLYYDADFEINLSEQLIDQPLRPRQTASVGGQHELTTALDSRRPAHYTTVGARVDAQVTFTRGLGHSRRD